MKYVNQNDYPEIPYRTRTDTPEDEYGKNTTVKSSGCGLASMVMVVDRLIPNAQFGILDALALALETHANHGTGTDYRIFAPAAAERFGLALEVTDDPEKLRQCLRSGGAAVVWCKNTPPDYHAVFTEKGHYIAAVAEEPDGRIDVLDPAYFPGKYDIPDRAGKVEMKCGVIAVVDMQVLVDDSRAKKPRSFFLFRRK